MIILSNDRLRYLEARLNELDGLRGKVIDYISGEMVKIASDLNREQMKIKPHPIKIGRLMGRQEAHRLMRDRIIDIYFDS